MALRPARHFGWSALASAWLGAVTLFAPPSTAEELRLTLPVDCLPGHSCWVAQYMDTRADGEPRDPFCGRQTYQGHDGTDFAIRDLASMRKGVAVVAAAAGQVRAARDGVEDGQWVAGNKGAVKQRECGNGVVIDHDNGWQTQYCHLQMGSVRVGAGNRVERRQTLGLVGLSGMTEFPHLHFSLRRHGTAVDPFTSTRVGMPCAEAKSATMWQQAGPQLMPRGGAVFNAALLAPSSALEDWRKGQAQSPDWRGDPAAVNLSVDMFGVRAGDEVELVVRDRHLLPVWTTTWRAAQPRTRQGLQFTLQKPHAGWEPPYVLDWLVRTPGQSPRNAEIRLSD